MGWVRAAKVLGKYASNRQLHAAYVCSVAQQLLGDEARVVSFKDGTLLLEVASSARAAHIHIQQAQVGETINSKLGQPLIEQLRYRVV